MTNYLVTGGAGFIGSHLVDRLVNENEITVIDNLSSGKKEYINPKANFYEKDLLKFNDILDIFDGINTVLHVAANPDVKLSAVDTKTYFDQNIVATYNVLEAMRKKDVSKIVFTSSSTIYGRAPMPTPEDYGPLIPESIYGASKLACEGLISSYCHTFGFKSWIFRFANIIGERSNHGVIPDFIEKLKTNPKELEILGDGKQLKSYLYVGECIDQILFAFNNSQDRVNIFNVGSQDHVSVSKIAELVSNKMRLIPKFIFTGGEIGWKGDIPRMLLDIDKLIKLGYATKYNSYDSVKKTIRELLHD
ncbi:MAG TPA: NAD-dependent epimerase/dehydratase family protein [Methanofastidiosum sp.]|nr:NAD-dependent epimerase/dehydratase family protein [Methanofastidiosum sp.]